MGCWGGAHQPRPREAAIEPHAPPFAAVLFDMDGSLVDTEPIWYDAEVDVMAAYGADWTPEDQQHTIGGPWLRVGTYMAARLAGQGGPELSPQRLWDELQQAFSRHLDSGRIAVYDGAEALLNEAMAVGLPLALVSNSTRELMDKVLAAHPRFRFDITIASDEVPHGKPHPGPYLAAASRLGVPIERCLVVEDSPNGVAAARESGAAVVAVAHVADVDPGPRGIVVNSLAGLTLDQLARRIPGAVPEGRLLE